MRILLLALSMLAVPWLAIVAAVVPACGTETLAADGVWWNQLTRNEQISVVEAAVEGFEGGFNAGAVAMGNYDSKFWLAIWNADYSVLLRERRAGRLSAAEFERIQMAEAAAGKTATAGTGDEDPDHADFPRTFGTYADEVTDFYADHPDAVTVRISSIMRCLANPPLLSCDTVAKDSRPLPVLAPR